MKQLLILIQSLVLALPAFASSNEITKQDQSELQTLVDAYTDAQARGDESGAGEALDKVYAQISKYESEGKHPAFSTSTNGKKELAERIKELPLRPVQVASNNSYDLGAKRVLTVCILIAMVSCAVVVKSAHPIAPTAPISGTTN